MRRWSALTLNVYLKQFHVILSHLLSKTVWPLPLLLAAWVLPGQIFAQGTVYFSEPVSIRTEGNLALALMLTHIQHLYSTAIDFEEAPIECPSELSVSPVIMKSGAHSVSAIGGKLTVQLDKNDRTAYEAVQTVLAAYVNAGLPGLYQAIDEGTRVDVVPIQTRAADCTMRKVVPFMDSSISLAYKPRGTYAMLQDIADAISKASGITVYMTVNGVMESLSPETELTGFSGEKARDALAKMTGFANQALFDPNQKAYYLNIAPVTYPSVPTAINGKMADRAF